MNKVLAMLSRDWDLQVEYNWTTLLMGAFKMIAAWVIRLRACRVPVYKRAFCTSPHSISLSVLHKTGWTLQTVGGYAPQEQQLSWKLGVPLQIFYWKCSLVVLDKFEATKFEHNRAFNLSKSYFRVRGLVEKWTGLENCATFNVLPVHSMPIQ